MQLVSSEQKKSDVKQEGCKVGGVTRGLPVLNESVWTRS